MGGMESWVRVGVFGFSFAKSVATVNCITRIPRASSRGGYTQMQENLLTVCDHFEYSNAQPTDHSINTGISSLLHL
jgi:hypothetical protein